MEEEQYVHLANHICLEPWSLTCLPCFPVVWLSEETLSSLGVLWIESMAPSPQPYPKNLQPGAKEGCFLLWLLGSIVPVVSVAPPPARSSEERVFSIGWTSPGKCSSHPNWNFPRTSQKAVGNREIPPRVAPMVSSEITRTAKLVLPPSLQGPAGYPWRAEMEGNFLAATECFEDIHPCLGHTCPQSTLFVTADFIRAAFFFLPSCSLS